MKKYVAYYDIERRENWKKKYACRIHIIDVISIALYLPLVISLDITLLTAKISGANVSMHQTNSGKSPKIRFPSYFHVL